MRHNTPTRKQSAEEENQNPYYRMNGESWQDGRGNWHYVENSTSGKPDSASIPFVAKAAFVFFLCVLILWIYGAFLAVATF